MTTQGQQCFVWFQRMLKALALISLGFTCVVLVLIMRTAVRATNINDLQKAFVVLSQTGFVLYCVLFAVAEFELLVFLRHLPVFRFLPVRGFGLAWMGIQLIAAASQMATAAASGDEAGANVMKVLATVAGWILISVGAIYLLLGVLCLRAAMDIDDDRKLEEALHEGGGGGGGGGGGSSSSEDAVLAANLALAMGIGLKDAKKKFGGAAGAKAARDHAKDALEKAAKVEKELEAAQRRARDQAAIARAQGAALADTTHAVAGVPVTPSAAAASPADDPYASAPPPGRRGAVNADDDDAPRRRPMTDADLEAAYYANKKFDH